MTRQEKILEKRKKLGRPAIGKGVQLNAMIRPEHNDALNAWRSDQAGKPSRSVAIRLILTEYLRSKGYLPK